MSIMCQVPNLDYTNCVETVRFFHFLNILNVLMIMCDNLVGKPLNGQMFHGPYCVGGY
jgi:hypothetical protein